LGEAEDRFEQGKDSVRNEEMSMPSGSSATTKRNVIVESENGSHYVTVNGQRWARFDKLEHAHAAAQGL
jgi:hypothetical protein